MSLLLSVLSHSPLHIHDQASTVEIQQSPPCQDHQDHAHPDPSDTETDDICQTCLFFQGLTTPIYYTQTTEVLWPAVGQPWTLLNVSPLTQAVAHPAEARAPPA